MAYANLFFKKFSNLYEIVGKIKIEVQYDVNNHEGKGYLFKPSFTACWNMNYMVDRQLESELTTPRPSKSISIKKLIKKDKWWNVW